VKVQIRNTFSVCFPVCSCPVYHYFTRGGILDRAHHIFYSSSSSSSEEGKGEKWNGGVGEETGEEMEQCVRE
jgi:hypothetical protein